MIERGTCRLAAGKYRSAADRKCRQPSLSLELRSGRGREIVLLSVAEGEDKPLKYPSIFFKSELLVLNKIDLLPYVPFDIAAAEENARKVHAGMEIVRVSCQTRDGLSEWLRWLQCRRQASTKLAAASS